ncbi:cobalamin-binding protein [Limnohabitans sp. JirII-29]|uniref:MerR family transcriptional regulator n=1 Tax=Limnohabitans sp. JirII-29 TaxID=1835756 RepID=UPI000D358628|nr:MerR family transcriptional regulator [Limnohabitans sp. JirII-29]PUE27722.1 cobalamin-binding protein [Limnohabitans sp. JirII-29]
MNFRADSAPVLLSIAAVERDTGLGKDTLRVWERRYGFPTPGRDAYGERTYPLEQVERLRLIKRLMDQGQRPGRIVPLPTEDLQRLSQSLYAAPQSWVVTPVDSHTDVSHYMQLIRSHHTEGLRTQLKQAMTHLGLKQFVIDVVAPVTTAVGDAWMRGEIEVFEEHVYTECVSALLRQAMDTLVDSKSEATPRVLLTTFPQEPHGLGLLMAQSMLALQGASCISLGTQTPLHDIAKAAQAHAVHVVALSFSSSMNPKHVVDGLKELSQLLPSNTEVWAGGQNPVLQRRQHAGVVCLQGLTHIAAEVQRWRAEHAT